MTNFLRHFPLENILLDLVLTFLLFFFGPSESFLAGVLPVSLWFLAPLQVVALYFAFEGKNGGVEELRPGKIRQFLGFVAGLNTVLAVGGFLWLLFIASAIESRTGFYPSWQVRFAFFIAVFGGILAFGLNIDRGSPEPKVFLQRLVPVLVTGLYLFCTESIIQAAISNGRGSLLLLIVVLATSYLPVRLALSFRSPFSYFDVFSAVFFFGVFILETVGAG